MPKLHEYPSLSVPIYINISGGKEISQNLELYVDKYIFFYIPKSKHFKDVY